MTKVLVGFDTAGGAAPMITEAQVEEAEAEAVIEELWEVFEDFGNLDEFLDV